MDKDKHAILASLVYDYLDSLSIPDAQVEIVGEGSHSFGLTITVPDGYKDDVDETVLYDLIGKNRELDDVEVTFSCYDDSELHDPLEEDVEDPDEGVGDEDPDDEDEVKADRLNVRSNPDQDDPDYLDEGGDYDPEGLDDDEEGEDYDPLPLNIEEGEEYIPDWDDVKDFFGDDDDR